MGRGRIKPLAFPERHGAVVLLFAGVIAWAGAVAATVAGQDVVATTAIPTGAALLGAAAYYSRVRKLPGVEIVESVLKEGASYEAEPDATPTEAVQDFARRLAGGLTKNDIEPIATRPTLQPYLLPVHENMPQRTISLTTWESTEDFARHLKRQGWVVRKEYEVGDRRLDLFATRNNEEMWVEIKGQIYALNSGIIREVMKQFPPLPAEGAARKIRRVLFLPTPPLPLSPSAVQDFRASGLELWYADARVPEGIVRAA